MCCSSVPRSVFAGGICLALAWCVAGCDLSGNPGADGASDGAGQQNLEAVKTAADRWPNPTDDECKAYAAKLEEAVKQGDKMAVISAVDWDSLFQKVVDSSEGMDDFKRGFMKGAKSSVGKPGGFADQMATVVATGGSYRFLRIRMKDKRKRVLFRLVRPEGGLNYHEMVMVKKPSGQTMAIDVYVYATAEFLSTTMRRIFLPMAANQNRNFLQKLTRQENAFVKHFDDFGQMTNALRTGQYERVLQIYKTLPESLQRDKTLLILRISAAIQVNDQEYEQALNTLQKFFSSDPCVDLMSIDHFAMKKQFDKSMACIAQLDKSVGGDPYLKVLRGNTLIAKGDLKEARQNFLGAAEADPSLVDAYWGFVSLSLQEKNHDDTLRRLKELDERFGMEWDDLATLEDYADFVKTPQYQEWVAYRKNK